MGQHGAGVGGDEGSLQKEGEHRRIESRSVARIPCQGQLYTPQAPPHPPHSGRSSGGGWKPPSNEAARVFTPAQGPAQ